MRTTDELKIEKLYQRIILNEKLGVVDNSDAEAENIFDLFFKHIQSIPYDFVMGSLINLDEAGKDAEVAFSKKFEKYKTTLSGETFKGLYLYIVFEQTNSISSPLETGMLLGMETMTGQIDTDNPKIDPSRYYTKLIPGISIKIRVGININTFDEHLASKAMDRPEKTNFFIKMIINNTLKKQKSEYVAAIAHELSHNLVAKKREGLGTRMRSIADYHSFSEMLGEAPLHPLHNLFYNMYFMHESEIHVIPTEMYADAKQQGITKTTFKEYLKNNRSYKKLIEIKDDTYEKFIARMVEQIPNINMLMKAMKLNPKDRTDDEKIKGILETAHALMVDKMVKRQFALGLMLNKARLEKGMNTQDFDDFEKSLAREMAPFNKDPEKFFKKKIASMAISANNQIKRISKIYDLLP